MSKTVNWSLSVIIIQCGDDSDYLYIMIVNILKYIYNYSNFITFTCIEFDFTVARGLGALHKELTVLKVQFILLGAEPAITSVIKGATDICIDEVSNELQLDTLLKGFFYLLINWFKIKHIFIVIFHNVLEKNKDAVAVQHDSSAEPLLINETCK